MNWEDFSLYIVRSQIPSQTIYYFCKYYPGGFETRFHGNTTRLLYSRRVMRSTYVLATTVQSRCTDRPRSHTIHIIRPSVWISRTASPLAPFECECMCAIFYIRNILPLSVTGLLIHRVIFLPEISVWKLTERKCDIKIPHFTFTFTESTLISASLRPSIYGTSTFYNQSI